MQHKAMAVAEFYSRVSDAAVCRLGSGNVCLVCIRAQEQGAAGASTAAKEQAHLSTTPQLGAGRGGHAALHVGHTVLQG